MAKIKDISKRKDGGAIKITTKSYYGSHREMVVSYIDDIWCICKDDTHEYKTLISRLDSGLADPYRNS